MKNKKRLCILMALVVMGAGVTVYAQEQAEVVDTELTQQQEQVKDNKDALEKAQEAIDNKDYQSAIVYLTGYISSKPKKYEAYKLRGQSFYALRQYKLAEMDFQTAIELKKDNDKFSTGAKVIGAVILGADKQEQYQNPELGNLYAGLMYAQKAMNLPAYEISYQNAVKYNSHIYLPQPKKDDIARINYPQKYGKILNPQGVDSYIFGAVDDIDAGNFLEASYKAQYIVSNFPKYYLGYYLLGVALEGLDKEDEAVSAFQNAIKFNPYDFESMASLGLIYYNKAEKTFSSDDQKKSNEYFTTAIKYNPNCHLYYYYIGLNQLQAGDYNSAIANFNKAIRFKSNDYNSSYYKLIAQYLKGEYSEVVDGCTNLLYRHVSNSNSVLYLRALAQNKLKNSAFAIADIETIQNNLSDIYNTEVNTISNKEKTLESYLYYLKAQILSEKGFGVKSDMAKALQNPLISTLNKGGNIEALTLQLSAADVENQYDYIRTTFDKLNVSFEYLNPNYKFISLKPVNSESEEVIAEQAQTPVISLKPTAEPQDIISSTNTSIAEMLASNALNHHSSEVLIEQPKVQATVQEEVTSNNLPVEPSKELEDEIVVLDPDTILFKAPIQKESESFEIKYEKVEPKVVQETEKVSEPLIAENIEEKPATSEPENIIIKSDVPPAEPPVEEVAPKEDEPLIVETKKNEIIAQAEPPAPPAVETPEIQETTEVEVPKVAEPVVENKSKIQHTNINLKGFGSEAKILPEIKEDDEVIVFVPEEKSFIKEIEQNLKTDTVALNTQKQITDNFASIKQNIEPDIVTKQEKEPVLIDPEEVKVPAKLLTKAKPMPVTEVVSQNDESETQINESAPISPEGLILTEEPVLKSDKENKKAKKEKNQKEVELKDFLAEEVAPVKEKPVKVKKEKKLKDFLSEADEVSSNPELNKKDENELKEFLNEEIAVAEQEVKKEKRSLFRRRQKAAKIEEPISTVDVEEPQVADTKAPEVVEDTPVNNEVQTIAPEQKTKKSWFGFFKRNKKTKITEPDKIEEIIEPQTNIEEPEKPVSVYEFDENKFEEILKGEEPKPEKRSGKKSKKVEKEQE